MTSRRRRKLSQDISFAVAPMNGCMNAIRGIFAGPQRKATAVLGRQANFLGSHGSHSLHPGIGI
eukprot:UC1_evm3s1739